MIAATVGPRAIAAASVVEANGVTLAVTDQSQSDFHLSVEVVGENSTELFCVSAAAAELGAPGIAGPGDGDVVVLYHDAAGIRVAMLEAP